MRKASGKYTVCVRRENLCEKLLLLCGDCTLNPFEMIGILFIASVTVFGMGHLAVMMLGKVDDFEKRRHSDAIEKHVWRGKIN